MACPGRRLIAKCFSFRAFRGALYGSSDASQCRADPRQPALLANARCARMIQSPGAHGDPQDDTLFETSDGNCDDRCDRCERPPDGHNGYGEFVRQSRLCPDPDCQGRLLLDLRRAGNAFHRLVSRRTAPAGADVGSGLFRPRRECQLDTAECRGNGARRDLHIGQCARSIRRDIAALRTVCDQFRPLRHVARFRTGRPLRPLNRRIGHPAPPRPEDPIPTRAASIPPLEKPGVRTALRTLYACNWRGAGVVERGGLENRCARKRTEGSNPSLSASWSVVFR